jgi:predicted NAD/FAD-binding protein
MAGVAAAWLLDGECDVILWESAKAIGGNIHTVDVQVDGHNFRVDMGAQYFHPGPYPLYTKLLSILGLYPSPAESHKFPTSITVYAESESDSRFVSPLVPDRLWPFIAPWNWEALYVFNVVFSAAKAREQQQGDWNVTMQNWLSSLDLSAAQRERFVLPWVASLFSGSIEQAREFSARAAMIFAAKALPDNPLEPLPYYVLNAGLVEALRRMLQQTSTVRVLTSSAVQGVVPHPPGGFRVLSARAPAIVVDDLIFASPAEPTRKLLQSIPGTMSQQVALEGIGFHHARLLLHSDPVYGPADPYHRSFLNCRVQGQFCEASMWMADVLAVPPRSSAAKLWKSWATHRDRDPKQILHEVHFRHMLPTVSSVRAQAALANLQGMGGIWFAGGYTYPYDAQETALRSAIHAVWGLQVSSARGSSLGNVASITHPLR